jgi:hypothetical protein
MKMRTVTGFVSLFYFMGHALGGGVNLTSLQPFLSPNASIAYSAVPRWSDYPAPHPGAVVNVATEEDVLVTVCI